MKVYLSADIEGVAGIAHWDEAMKDKADYRYFQEQMTREVAAACEGAVAAGATEILVKDAHGSARNITPTALPRCARIIRGWSGHPYFMMQELDGSFAAACFVGYHSRAGSGANPMAHTYSSRSYSLIRLNGRAVSEFALNTMTARREGVPVAFLSGDAALCHESREDEPGAVYVPVTEGIGASTLALHPDVAVERIREGVREALGRKLRLGAIPGTFKVEVTYREAASAYRSSFYPGCRLVSDHVVGFESAEWMDVLRLLIFAR